MKAIELRIGNLIYGCYDTEPEEENEESKEIDVLCKFIGYDPFEKYLWVEAIDGVDYEFSNFNPIPLTEEWLVKFGFKKNDEDRFDKRMELSFIDGIYHFRQGWTNVKLKYVHQLQNLYFALTGKELTLK